MTSSKRGECATRNERVGIALDEKATTARKEAGETWEAVGSLLVTARLKLASPGQKRPGAQGKQLTLM